MTVDHFLKLYQDNITTVIEVLFISILVGVTLILFFSVFRKKSKDMDSEQLSQIEETLKKVLDRTSVTIQGAPDSVVEEKQDEETERPSEMRGELNKAKEQAEQLQGLLSDKDQELKKLKESLAAAQKKSVGGENATQMQAKIDELEGKLLEYEIIEEDIADLSFYKEENSRLKRQIETMGTAPTSVETVAPSIPVSAVNPVTAPAAPKELTVDDLIGDDLMAEFAAAVETPRSKLATTVVPPEVAPVAVKETSVAAPAISAATSVTPTAAIPVIETFPVTDPQNVADDLMAEFAAAVEQQKATEQSAKTPVETNTPVAEPVPYADTQSSVDDIFDEFAAAVEQQKVETSKAEIAPKKVEAAPKAKPTVEEPKVQESAPQQTGAAFPVSEDDVLLGSRKEPDEALADSILDDFAAVVAEQNGEEEPVSKVAASKAPQQALKETSKVIAKEAKSSKKIEKHGSAKTAKRSLADEIEDDAPTEVEVEGVTDDIMAEFTSKPEDLGKDLEMIEDMAKKVKVEPPPVQTPVVPADDSEDTLDLDKMAAEVAALADAEIEDDENVLAGDLDTDKLLSEAEHLDN